MRSGAAARLRGRGMLVGQLWRLTEVPQSNSKDAHAAHTTPHNTAQAQTAPNGTAISGTRCAQQAAAHVHGLLFVHSAVLVCEGLSDPRTAANRYCTLACVAAFRWQLT